MLLRQLSYCIATVVLCESEDWSDIQREEQRLSVFEERMHKKIFWGTRDEVRGDWRRLHNEELHDVYVPSDIRVTY